MRFDIEKPKTWKGLSYILKSSVLEDAIISNNLDCNVHLIYWTPQRDNKTDCSLIEAEYWLSNQNVDYARFYIRTGVVPSSDRKKAETLFTEHVLPNLIDWMKHKITLPNNSSISSGMFCAFYKNGNLVIEN
ncbi:hypothetical protein [Cytophaga aurantiaca]|uniref:hypothetical protein n=1 Tax=Cytophaga aurantiaca TaxID=29530 RepID=UPI00037302DA|nr:hypothetical protein [Cytophaga aurantiaca]